MSNKEQKLVNGALGGIRTHGLSLRRAALYPLSYKRVKTNPLPIVPGTRPGTVMGIGAEGGSRTHTPFQALRPERSASTISPLRHVTNPGLPAGGR